MAGEPRLPNPLEKRDLLYSRVKNERVDYITIGDAFLEKGRLSEAAEFYFRGEAREKLLAVRDRAIRSGDAPLLIAVAVLLGDGVETKDWAALASAALRLEKYTAAAEAFETAGRTEDAAKARERYAALLGTTKPPEPTADPESEPEDPGQAGKQTKTGG
jgi:hypothetical protein